MSEKRLAPFRPSASNPFDRRKAAHLIRRAGFGAPAEAVEKAVASGLEETVERLFEEAEQEEAAYEQTFQAINGKFTNFADAGAVKAWWVYRMATTTAPLSEKLTLFWHGHFATSVEKVEDPALSHRQLATLRRLAWGNFRELVLAMAKDPAMLVWLDGESNTKEHPNENFARELMELFTCGIGHYTETDVKEAARAFTGWNHDNGEFEFVAEDHDGGVKRFLGKSGRFDGADVVDILMQQPDTPRFLAGKLLRFFAAPAPPDDVVDEAAELLDRTRLHIKWFLRDLFLSEYFHSADCYRARIASPAELVVGTVRTLRISWPSPQLVEQLEDMGQSLLEPPNVKGWDGEAKWINSTSWAARVAFADQLSQLAGEGLFASRLDPGAIIPRDAKDPEAALDRLLTLLQLDDLAPEARRGLIEHAIASEEGSESGRSRFRDDDSFRSSKIRSLLAVVLGLPEYQVY